MHLYIHALEVNLTQNWLPQLQDLYHLPLHHNVGLHAALVYSKFQYGMNICMKAHIYSFRVHPIIHEYSDSYTPLWDKNAITK